MSELVNQIKSRGYWSLRIRPTEYVEHKVPRTELFTTVQKSSVRLRGWDFPAVDSSGIEHNDSFIASSTEWDAYREYWRMYESGQFVFLWGLYSDWADVQKHDSSPSSSGQTLDVVDVVYTATEMFEFAHRLSISEAGSSEIQIDIELHGISGRKLHADMRYYAGGLSRFQTSMNNFSRTFVVTRDELAKDKDIYALDMSKEIFERFGWTPNQGVIEQYQRKLRELRGQHGF